MSFLGFLLLVLLIGTYPLWTGTPVAEVSDTILRASYSLENPLRGEPEVYPDPVKHFKYGSIGSDSLVGGLPYWIFKVLLEMFSKY